MLIDEWLSTTKLELSQPEAVWGNEPSRFARGERLRQTEATYGAMRKAQNFVASPLVVETASSLASDIEAIKRSATHFFLPATTTWLDLTADVPAGGLASGRHGVLLVADGASVMKGVGLVVVHLRRAPGHEVDWGDGGFMQLAFQFDLSRGNLGVGVHREQIMMFASRGGEIGRLLATTWATIAMINTPRLSHVRQADLSRINKGRLASKKPPILQYKTVSIQVDRGELGVGFQKHETAHRPLHHVRAFLRIKRGKVELVRPHWRGSPRFGVVVHRYVALRAEDEAGPWQGGPLPPPRVIQELSE